jgi:hypothetical protein
MSRRGFLTVADDYIKTLESCIALLASLWLQFALSAILWFHSDIKKNKNENVRAVFR